MTNKIRKQTSGFTIIEVLIVLAIAGLILLIVFLAVPALQRNSRNTQYRSEATRLLGVTSEFVNNNNGNLPSGAAVISCSGTGGAAGNCDYNNAANNNAEKIWLLANPKNITDIDVGIADAVTAVTPTIKKATIVTGVTCGASTQTTVTPAAGPKRSIILIYAIEDSTGAAQAQCSAS